MNTVDDTIDEFDGSVTITLLPPEQQAGVTRPYYLVDSSDASREIIIRDNDPLLTN